MGLNRRQIIEIKKRATVQAARLEETLN